MPKTRRLNGLNLHQKQFGPDTTWESQDDFLLALMKLRLGLLGKDIAHRFGISNTLWTQIFHSWMRGIAILIILFIPDIETILAATLKNIDISKI